MAAGVRTFCLQILQCNIVQHRVSQQPLKLRVLKLPQPASRRYFQSAILGLSVVNRRFGYAVPPREIAGLGSRLCLLQHANNLLF
jgi:hypothetical protein